MPEERNGDEPYAELTAELFLNNKVLSAKDSAGGTLSVGMDSAEVAGLVINPKYSDAEPGHKYGYYVSTGYNSRLFLSQSNGCDIDGTQLAETSNVVIDWTFDKLRSAEYKSDTDYGIYWTPQMDDETQSESSVKLVVVDCTSHNIISTYMLEIIRNNNGKYELAELYNSDINAIPSEKAKALWDINTEDISGDEQNSEIINEPAIKFEDIDITEARKQLIDAALEQIQSEKYISVEEQFKTDSAVVELTNSTYHLKYLTSAHETGYTGNTTYPVWAVTINSTMPDIGHYTFYFSKTGNVCLGCDFFYLNTEDELNRFMSK